ncbi:FecR family protein [Chondrinema litorale]|uniref:FecR family protein n=1 Tax=Chondrinema litorale TaxID=2994555 RepID=UPI0025439702|nr:FecR family protein [Chondrinema litorale]UZR99918.1 DUF4974 domain-containing protein [Chondrinema litorale]
MKRPEKDKILRYFADEASTTEAEEVISWFNTKEGAAYLESSFFQNDEEDSSVSSHFFTENAFYNLDRRIQKDDEKEAIHNELKRRHKRQSSLIAASLVLIVAFISLYTYKLEQHKIKNEITSVKLEVRENPKGQKSTLLLPDGTEIKLNVESRLVFEEGFKGNERKVYLNGEAFFNIAEDKTRPFIVYVNDSIEVKALGTSFNIKAFQDESNINIALTTGKVQITNRFEKKVKQDIGAYYLIPGEAYSFNTETGISSSSTFDIRQVIAWKDGYLIFNDTPFEESKRMLERWYGVEIEIKSKYRRITPFTGEFHNESLKNILENMSMACKFNYSISGKKILIF